MRTVRGALVVVLLVVLASRAEAADTLQASAVCNGKWVNVTIDAPDTAIIVARYGGKAVAVGNKFVPDTGGGNAAGDYDIDILLEEWDTSTVAAHKVLRSATVRTPSCAPATSPTTRAANLDSAPANPSVVATPTIMPPTIVEPALSWLPALPDSLLRAIVEAVRGLP